jgi:hypothetical protein
VLSTPTKRLPISPAFVAIDWSHQETMNALTLLEFGSIYSSYSSMIDETYVFCSHRKELTKLYEDSKVAGARQKHANPG